MLDKNQQEQQDNPTQSKPPIIIKRIVQQAHGHHGGAWKVAYADFVTAMMAFFLLLWLLNAVPQEKLRGIADYFEPTVGIKGAKGIGFEGGRSLSTPGTSNSDKELGVEYGVISKGEIVSTPEVGSEIKDEERENERFTLMEGELKKVLTSDANLSQFSDSVTFEMTPEGLVIKVIDQDKLPMFKKGGVELEVYAKNILTKIVGLIKYSPNFIAISGFTESSNSPIQKDYSNWELSIDRANAARKYIVEQGISPDQIAKLIGRADTAPLDPGNPNSPRNRRIEITLLRNSIMPFNKISAPKQLIGNSLGEKPHIVEEG
ncbi:MAG: flagellar motor protein MotB [Candidatus Midichloriaceae bacterium]|jgi:chemotaxis protein MotB|nr:flagellar motor protein MotB [Candidatus Midichloriaceae bacterium]